MAKSNPITMRLEEEIKSYIDSLEGSSFTDKFETLVKEYRDTIPQRQEQVRYLDIMIAKKQVYFDKLCIKLDVLKSIVDDINDLGLSVKDVQSNISKLLKM